MRALMLEVPETLLAHRRQHGLDRWDEMWEGMLHMVPPPHHEHGRLNDELGTYLKLHWEADCLGKTFPETGVKRPGVPSQQQLGEAIPSDYRVPDRSFLCPERYGLLQGGWIVGGPDAVLEIVSPGDESRQKLPFYLALGVREAILIDRDSKQVEIFRASASEFVAAAPDAAGWIASEVLKTELRREVVRDGRVRLHIRRSDLPERGRVIEG